MGLDIKSREDRKKDAIRNQLTRELYKKSFYEFFKDACKVLEPQTDWQYGWYIEYICDTLQNEIQRIVRREKKDRDIILNVPPRFSKSNIISIVFPVWIWLVYPECKILSLSHSDILAVDHSSSSFRLIQDPWFKNLFPDIELSKDQSSKSFYANTKGGKRLASSMGANNLGLTANVLILDDPNKSSSAVDVENVIKVYREILYNRLANPDTDIRIILQQRLSENDLTGWCLKNSPDQYRHICLPATNDNGNVFPPELSDKYEDGLLFPQRFDRFRLESVRTTLGSWGYSSQFLLSPTSLDGDIIKRNWFEIVETAPSIDYHLFIDPAYTKLKANDPSGIVIVGLNPVDRCLYVKEAFEVWLEFPALITKVNELAKFYPKAKIYIEPKASGLSLVQSLRSSTDLNVIELPAPTKDKVTRVNAVTPKMEAKRVKLVKGDWNESYLNQMCSFPKSAHDDLVDCTVYAINKLVVQVGTVNLRSL